MMLEKAETLQEEADGIKAEIKDMRNANDVTFNELIRLPENK